MYKNLESELTRKGISVTSAAAILGIPEATFRSKLKGQRECGFSVEEAMNIKKNLFPEIDLTGSKVSPSTALTEKLQDLQKADYMNAKGNSPRLTHSKRRAIGVLIQCRSIMTNK